MSREWPARRVVFTLCALAWATQPVFAAADASGGTALALRGGASGTALALRGGASGTAPALRGGASLTAPRIALFASGPHADAWARRLAAQWGPLQRDPVARAAATPPSVARERMRTLARIEALLMGARSQAASLHESDALASLAAAERAVDAIADVPGVSAWMAEVQLQLGAVAAQAGLRALAEAAFLRAATLEPGRQLLPAEAAPDVVALCARIHAELAVAPAGAFVVRVTPDGARVFLDDVELGPSPVRARAPVGRHLLRIEADGHRTYGSFVDVLPGERPELAVQLTPLPALELARALQRAARAGAFPQIAAELNAAGADGRAALDQVAIVETTGSGARALIVRCDRSGCRAPIRARATDHVASGTGVLEPGDLAAARAWLSQPAGGGQAAGSGAPLWRRWYVWGGAVLAVTAGALALGFALRPEPEHRLRVVVDPGAL